MTNRALALAYLIRRLDQGLYRTLNGHLQDTVGLSYSQFVVLATINTLERGSAADVAAYLYQARSSVLPHIKSAINRGYVQSFWGHGHSRERALFITERGSRTLELAMRSGTDALRKLQRPGEVWSDHIEWLLQINRRLSRQTFPSHLLHID